MAMESSRSAGMFYLMENDGSTSNPPRFTEAYCTTFIAKAKALGNSSMAARLPTTSVASLASHRSRPQHPHSQNSHQEQRYKRVAERWREEGNRGVQMPIDRTRQAYTFEQCDGLSTGAVTVTGDVFELPSKLIAGDTKRYVHKQTSQSIARQATFHYELDRVDEQWLTSLLNKQQCHSNKKGPTSILTNTFLRLMNAFEVECYRKIHLLLLEPLMPSPSSSSCSTTNIAADEDAACSVCEMPEWEPGGEIVFCDGCNLSVHQSCYGLEALPTDSWLCHLCRHRQESTERIPLNPSCLFCPVRGGAMKYIRSSESWAHVVCALWIPEVRFGDVDLREPITNVGHIPLERWQWKCCVCDTRQGVCIGCTHTGCPLGFHVCCAQRASLPLRIESAAGEQNGCRMVSLCPAHSSVPSPMATSPSRSPPVSPTRRRPTTPITTAHSSLSQMMHSFWRYVDCQQVSVQLGVDAATAARVFAYWKWKRIQKHYLPLIGEPVGIRVVPEVYDKLEAEKGKGARGVNKTPRVKATPRGKGAAARERSHSGRPTVSPLQLRAYENLYRLRQNLDRALNLSHMVIRRERLKKAAITTLEEAVMSNRRHLPIGATSPLASTAGGGSNGTRPSHHHPPVPISRRKSDKLLDIWLNAVKQLQTGEAGAEHKVRDFRLPANGLTSPSVTATAAPISNGKKDGYDFRASSSSRSTTPFVRGHRVVQRPSANKKRGRRRSSISGSSEASSSCSSSTSTTTDRSDLSEYSLANLSRESSTLYNYDPEQEGKPEPENSLPSSASVLNRSHSHHRHHHHHHRHHFNSDGPLKMKVKLKSRSLGSSMNNTAQQQQHQQRLRLKRLRIRGRKNSPRLRVSNGH